MKKLIYAMSFTRKDVLKRLESMSEEISDHIIKCVVYKNDLGQLDHWAGEISTLLNRANRARSKTKLKEKDYYTTLFSTFGDDESDADINLDYFRNRYCKKYSQYPDFEITHELAVSLYRVYSYIIEQSLNILLSTNIQPIYEWKQIVLHAINLYCE